MERQRPASSAGALADYTTAISAVARQTVGLRDKSLRPTRKMRLDRVIASNIPIMEGWSVNLRKTLFLREIDYVFEWVKQNPGVLHESACFSKAHALASLMIYYYDVAEHWENLSLDLRLGWYFAIVFT